MDTFEKDLKKLEELSAAIKKSDISLEDALKDFEEGIKLAKSMEKELDAIESKIQILMNAPQEEESEGSKADSGKGKKAKPAKQAMPELELFDGTGEIRGTRNA